MIAQIEDAILGKLNAINDGRLGYKVGAIDTYGGQFDDQLDQVIRRLPGIWVVFAGSGKPVPYGTSRTKWKVPATFAVMVGARSVRGEPFSRRGLQVNGQTAEVGSYQMLEDMRRALLGQDFSMEISPFAPGVVRTLYNTRMNDLAMSVFAQEWHTAFVIGPEALPDEGDLLSVGLNYDLIPPGDGKPDVSDLVTLTQ